MGKQMTNCSRGLLLLLLALLACFSIPGHVYGKNLDYTRSASMNEGRNNVNINGLVPVPCNIFSPSKVCSRNVCYPSLQACEANCKPIV
uniref:MEG n=1 Tax=Oryza glumipatula TaxID=40148 RepID=A0A0D9ZGS0_9ORYZ